MSFLIIDRVIQAIIACKLNIMYAACIQLATALCVGTNMMLERFLGRDVKELIQKFHNLKHLMFSNYEKTDVL